MTQSARLNGVTQPPTSRTRASSGISRIRRSTLAARMAIGQLGRGRTGARLRPDITEDRTVAARNFVVVILDSLRFDSWVAAEPQTLAQLGPVERRWSYATWTAPSHYNLLMGLLPHTSPPEVYASEYYKQDFIRYAERLGIPDMEFKSLLPSIFLPTYLKHSLGYRTHARVSMPVLNKHTAINRDFDSYELMPKHNDMAAMLPEMRFDGGAPAFHLLNVRETHYPYAEPDEDPSKWPHISGVHGVFKRLDERDEAGDAGEVFDPAKLPERYGRPGHVVRDLGGA